ncbi:cytochrome c peroxidase [Sorangium sp. So ce296]|uniref:cytochrome c peroxidase n=1 Tax=Sorangium sp. So ce296 TaxID=3133296 RepID=UPI003F5E5A21
MRGARSRQRSGDRVDRIMTDINLINTTLDQRYLILGLLGEGGMGAVYEARHLGTGRRVAVKVITSKLAQDDAVMARFEREARAAGAIESEHIASVLDSGRDRATGLPFLVMELLSGEDVDQMLRRLGPLPPELALCIVAQACMGLIKAHDARVLHRDIKPANLFLARRDRGEYAVKLLDFGVAKIQADDSFESHQELTATSNLIGSPIYMSPEQARNMKDVDGRTDLWSLGIVLFKMLAGRTPYRNSRGLGELIVAICSTPAPPIQSLAPWVTYEVGEIVHRALQIDRNLRFQSAEEMLEECRILLPHGFSIREEMLQPLPESLQADIPPPSRSAHPEAPTRRPPTPVHTSRTPTPGGTSRGWPDNGDHPTRRPPTPVATPRSWQDHGDHTGRRPPTPVATPRSWPEHVTAFSQSGQGHLSQSGHHLSQSGQHLGQSGQHPSHSSPVIRGLPDGPPSSRTVAGTSVPFQKTIIVAGEPPPAAARPRSRAAPLVAAAALVAATGAGVGAWLVQKTTAAAPSTATGAAPAAPMAPAGTAAAPGATAAAPAEPSVQIDPERLASFNPLPAVVTSSNNPLTDEKIHLGRMLFYDARLSKNHDLSCNSCHPLDRYGADGTKVSIGHAHQSGRRNTPSVYNSAGFFSLMWDGRFDSVEDQANGPMMNPSEMAMTPVRLEATLRSIPDYVKAFGRAFPNDPWPVTVGNTAKAIGAFERKLFTRGRWDQFLEGERDALTNAEKEGFNTFVEVGCVTCHFGPHVGATMFQKLGLVRSWPDTMDRGVFEITKKQADFMVFRVPTLRNVAATAPYFHDGSISSLEEAVRLMGKHQLGKDLVESQVHQIVVWLKSLTGELPKEYIAKPALPESGPNTPKPVAD